jgi:predicted dinucleotide-binding enzyme
VKIGIVGSGDVGQTLGSGLAALGHDVKIGTRDPQSEKIKMWMAKTGKRASAGSFGDAASFGEIVILATNWSGTESALKLAGADHFAGKVVIDLVNPLAFGSDGSMRLAIGCTDSAGEQIQRWLPKARVVKAFNTVGVPHMIKPQFSGGPPTMFICGDDEAARNVVADLLKVLGWDVVDAGAMDGARLLEPLGMLWIRLYLQWKTTNHAFKLLKK